MNNSSGLDFALWIQFLQDQLDRIVWERERKKGWCSNLNTRQSQTTRCLNYLRFDLRSDVKFWKPPPVVNLPKKFIQFSSRVYFVCVCVSLGWKFRIESLKIDYRGRARWWRVLWTENTYGWMDGSFSGTNFGGKTIREQKSFKRYSARLVAADIRIW